MKYISDKELVFKLYNKLLKVNDKKIDNQNMGERSELTPHKVTHMTNKLLKGAWDHI
jgi:hypothetical protein